MLGAIVALLPITVADCGALLQSGHSTAMVRDQYLGKGAAAGRAAAKARQTARNAMKLRQAARAQAVQAPSSEFKAA